MDTNKMREQFEAKFPAPIGMVWCDVAQKYVKALGCICPATAITAQNQLWKCWQASREAVVVEVPTFAEAARKGTSHLLRDFRNAIVAKGLKVAP